jgi:hypothetical protein
MSKTSPKQRYTQNMEWLSTRVKKRKQTSKKREQYRVPIK